MIVRISTILLVLIGSFHQVGFIQAEEKKASALTKVYGEWLIRPQPDKGTKYRQLIEKRGLPLFREAGGRMVGWWNTLVGDLYEHVTIWEYDDMAAFQKAAEFLGKNDKFAKFVALRDPLLTGVHLLLRNRSDDDKVAAAGWVYEPGKGRLCHLANGHTRDALLHPMYQALLRNAVNWCLRREATAPNKKPSI